MSPRAASCGSLKRSRPITAGCFLQRLATTTRSCTHWSSLNVEKCQRPERPLKSQSLAESRPFGSLLRAQQSVGIGQADDIEAKILHLAQTPCPDTVGARFGVSNPNQFTPSSLTGRPDASTIRPLSVASGPSAPPTVGAACVVESPGRYEADCTPSSSRITARTWPRATWASSTRPRSI